MLPNFIIAGTTRSGTTSLFYYLQQHSDISFPKLKEPRYFSKDEIRIPQNGPGDFTVDNKLILSFNEYRELYKNINNRYVGDASSEYLYHHKVSAPLIKEALGDIPIIIMLRNPIHRAFSAYNNLVRDGRETLTFREALNTEEVRILENWDMMWHYKSVGLYSEQVNTYLELFTNVNVIIFEEFIKNPKISINNIVRQFNLKTINDINVDVKYSASGKPKSKFLSILTSRNYKLTNYFRLLLLKLIPRKHLEKISSSIIEKEIIESSIVNELKNYYLEDIKRLEELIGRELIEWNIT